MHRYRIRIAVSLSAVCFVACLSAFGASGDETQTKGMIISRTGETLIVSGPKGHVTVVLTEDTRTKDDRGLFGLATEVMADTVLIPGLKVRVDGAADSQGRLVAKTITVDGDDLETAEMIQSGVHPTAEQVAANLRTLEAHRGQLAGHDVQLASHKENIESNKQNIAANQQNIATNRQQIEQNIKDVEEHSNRFTALAEYEVKGDATVKFGVASGKTQRTSTNGERTYRIHHRGDGLCGLDRKRSNKYETKRATRKSSDNSLDAAGRCAGTAYRRAGCDGRIWSSSTQRDEGGTSGEPPRRSQNIGE